MEELTITGTEKQLHFFFKSSSNKCGPAGLEGYVSGSGNIVMVATG